ncbi:hypothetical protein CFIO01_04767 [Colletotrichum fioriniae PJ7]|uniref:Uncharacterized protein n=1 Tax=Colletotrichum fioriniae PJ7 TaxID=1445577 RepID=A0A010S1U4_9PEZI|nr:hypothetical protein CFIO01_04767 [Colletotrichum fioriniae PJ7]
MEQLKTLQSTMQMLRHSQSKALAAATRALGLGLVCWAVRLFASTNHCYPTSRIKDSGPQFQGFQQGERTENRERIESPLGLARPLLQASRVNVIHRHHVILDGSWKSAPGFAAGHRVRARKGPVLLSIGTNACPEINIEPRQRNRDGFLSDCINPPAAITSQSSEETAHLRLPASSSSFVATLVLSPFLPFSVLSRLIWTLGNHPTYRRPHDILSTSETLRVRLIGSWQTQGEMKHTHSRIQRFIRLC